MDELDTSWAVDWLWSLPLIVSSVLIHVLGLGLIYARVVRILTRFSGHRRFLRIFAAVMGVTVLLTTVLHGLEAGMWAIAFRALDAMPDFRSAMLYSLSAMTTYGHANLFLPQRWQMMGSLEALNGVLLFGLTTAFLFAMIQQVWPMGRGKGE